MRGSRNSWCVDELVHERCDEQKVPSCDRTIRRRADDTSGDFFLQIWIQLNFETLPRCSAHLGHEMFKSSDGKRHRLPSNVRSALMNQREKRSPRCEHISLLFHLQRRIKSTAEFIQTPAFRDSWQDDFSWLGVHADEAKLISLFMWTSVKAGEESLQILDTVQQ